MKAMNNKDFVEYTTDPDLWPDLVEISDILVRFPFYMKCDQFSDAVLLAEQFDRYFEDQDLFMVCRQYDNFVFFESEEARAIAAIIK
ncbi:MAG: hypothetical protein M0R77_19085 [Gammaproteobacteria bacterium]|nr:hypothetical protein [Gammaproteobacteria bacterium]